jgi:hypothetical protein
MESSGSSSVNGYSRFGQPVLSWTRATVCGRARPFGDVACGEWFYLVVGLLASAVTFALTVERLLDLPRGSDDYIFAWVSQKQLNSSIPSFAQVSTKKAVSEKLVFRIDNPT